MLDPAGCVTSWNKGAECLKGYATGEIIGRHFSCSFTLPDQDTGLPGNALAAARQHGIFEDEGWPPFLGDLGELLGFTKVTRDIH